MKTSYQALVTRDDKWWLISVEGINGLSQARRLSEVEQNAKELISAATGSSIEFIDVTMNVERVGTVKVARRLAAVTEKRSKAAELETAASSATRELAADLASAGIPLRDIGTLLGVSFQRAHQLVNA
jgi:predicted RNase H-like HicB family nuclease